MDTWQIYVLFRQQQSLFLQRPYRLPKNWETHYSKMNKINQDALKKMNNHMITIWSNIDLERYFQYGFELFGKNFTYRHWFDKSLINLYKTKDKILKRNTLMDKKRLIESIKFVKDFMKEHSNQSSILLRYTNMKHFNSSVPIQHYIKSKIDSFLLVYLIKYRHMTLSDDDKSKIPYVIENYRTIVSELELHKDVIEKLEEM